MEYKDIWNKVLNPNEEVKYEFSVGGTYRKFSLIVGLVIAGLLLIASYASDGLFGLVIIVTLITVGRYWYLKVANAYAFTDKRILIHRGWLSTTTQSVDYNKITEISISEPFFARIFTNSGDMSIHTGNITDAIVLKNIETPYETKKKLDALRHS